ncbi:MAG: hypothetical protein R6U32_01390 [Candidatus Woesearchaeota archaeon]
MEYYEFVAKMEPQLKDIAEEAKKEKQREDSERLPGVEEENERLKKEYMQLQDMYSELEEKTNNLKYELKQREKDYSELQRQYQNEEQRRKEAERELGEWKKDYNALEGEKKKSDQLVVDLGDQLIDLLGQRENLPRGVKEKIRKYRK